MSKAQRGNFLRFTKEEFGEIPSFESLEDVAKSLGVKKVNSIVMLYDSVIVFYEDPKDRYDTYYEVDKEFLVKDAEIRLDEYLGLDDPDTYDENFAHFRGEYGFEPTELCNENSDHYLLDILADDFAENKDCNVADNDTWRDVISNELKSIKEIGC